MKLLGSEEEAIRSISSGQTVFLGTACGEPVQLVAALAKAVVEGKLDNLTVISSYPVKTASDILGLAKSSCKVVTLFPGPGLRGAVRAGLVDYLPGRLSVIGRWFRQRVVPVDVALVQVSPPDEAGYCSLGVAVDYTKAAVEAAPLVIAEVNARMPRVFGDTLVHEEQISYGVQVDYEVSENPPSPLTSEAKAIARNVVELIPGEATLQVGIGGLGDAVAAELMRANRRFRLHTGMLSDAWLPLLDLGTRQRAGMGQGGGAVASMLIGTKKLYAAAHENPAVELYPSDFVHSPEVIGKLSRFCAVNFALEVDLTGQVNGETVAGKQVGAMGGQSDFVAGAALNEEGLCIIALPSTTRDGRASRVVPRLDTVTTIRSDVDYVVTEFGVAALRGKSLQERMEQMVSIAHPQFREFLAGYIRGEKGETGE